MTRPTHVALLAILMSAAASAQDVSVYSTTIAQVWKQELPGFDKQSFAPATQFLGIDASKIGMDGLSLHLYGWGQADLADQSQPAGKTSGYLSYGYLQYRFPTANAEIKAGRFSINNGVGIEQVDGVSARADLKGGFTVSAFGGRPVIFRTANTANQQDYEFQRNWIAGARIGLRVPKVGEIGVSYLQDGQNAAKDLPIPSPVDYSRRQVGVDVRIAPVAAFDLSGRTVFDVAKHADPAAGQSSPEKIAEHDYAVKVGALDNLYFTGNFTQRNFFAYFAGTNLPSLFRQDEKDKFRAFGGSVVYGSIASIQVVADVKRTHRESYGDANRFGADLRWAIDGLKFKSGFGYHKVSADNVLRVDSVNPTYSLSHGQFRAWVMYDRGILSSSLDALVFTFDDKSNPNLNGKSTSYEVVASLGAQVTPTFKLSGDLGIGSNPLANREVMGLLRAEYRFGTRKGGSK